ncbi:hypothetical protein F2Q69_00060752 [Brassica cretica]|uniref:Uncharacterized protein n=1 Tax=Brassica cretica TaxID=69181 RepID=A0A8S9RK56_BRACR|nr:hypothetical protein F2Q69_00060752 [Brassica cretica]
MLCALYTSFSSLVWDLQSTACSPLETYGVWSGLLWVKAGPGTCQACFAS